MSIKDIAEARWGGTLASHYLDGYGGGGIRQLA